MIPLDVIDELVAPPGMFYVERLAMPARRGLILLPYASQEYNRAAEGVVVITNHIQWDEGVKVILGGSVARSITFGYGSGERTLWLCTPGQVLAIVNEFPERMIEKGEQNPLRHYTSADHDEFAEAREKFDEGEPSSLQ